MQLVYVGVWVLVCVNVGVTFRGVRGRLYSVWETAGDYMCECRREPGAV